MTVSLLFYFKRAVKTLEPVKTLENLCAASICSQVLSTYTVESTSFEEEPARTLTFIRKMKISWGTLLIV